MLWHKPFDYVECQQKEAELLTVGIQDSYSLADVPPEFHQITCIRAHLKTAQLISKPSEISPKMAERRC